MLYEVITAINQDGQFKITFHIVCFLVKVSLLSGWSSVFGFKLKELRIEVELFLKVCFYVILYRLKWHHQCPLAV